jgi:hypothetical protein
MRVIVFGLFAQKGEGQMHQSIVGGPAVLMTIRRPIFGESSNLLGNLLSLSLPSLLFGRSIQRLLLFIGRMLLA